MKQINFSDSQIQEYSKKIFGFALLKTGNHHLAEDLSQEILLSLLNSLRSGRHIDHMDAWVYRICCYTWSNYVSKEKRYWRTADIDELELHGGLGSPEDEHILKDSLDRMKRELAYLNQLHRDIFVMFYYENKSVKTISVSLNIPEGTIKWHLSEARKKIKEGMKMENTSSPLSLNPVRLWAGHCGSPGPKGEPNIYFDTLLASNIFVAAYEQPVSIEDIARSLSVSSAYVEDYIHKFEHSDLIKKVGKDKYQTNFIIGSMKIYAEQAKYLKTKAEELAADFYQAVVSILTELKAIGFYGNQSRDTFLLWAFIPYAINYQFYRVKDKEYYVQNQPDERKDGGKYIVQAGIQYDDQQYQQNIPDFERIQKYRTNGVKSRNNGKYSGLQMETWWSGLRWRDFNAPDIIDMQRVIELIDSGEKHTEHDKELISRMVQKGFVSNKNGALECLIPFFKPFQYQEFIRILERALLEIDAKAKLEQVHDDFVQLWQRLAPRHISKKEVVYKAINEGGHIVFAILEYLEHNGILELPAEEEMARLTTLMWIRSDG